MGMSILLISRQVTSTLFLDAPYHLNQEEFKPAAGIETNIGPLAFRAGYKSGSELQKITVGAGFSIGSTSVDYAFGMVDDLDSTHRVSLGIKFGKGKVR